MLAPPWVKIRKPTLYLKQIQDMKDKQELEDAGMSALMNSDMIEEERDTLEQHSPQVR